MMPQKNQPVRLVFFSFQGRRNARRRMENTGMGAQSHAEWAAAVLDGLVRG